MFLLLSFIFLVSKQRFIANVVHWRVLTDENLKKQAAIILLSQVRNWQ